MVNVILMWIGIGLVVVGWLALGWQASKWMAQKAELDKFPQRKQQMLLRRNYCRLIILGGIVFLILAALI